MMIGTVMFLGGFFASLLAFYGRKAPLLMLAVILLAFCWVGNERVHKAFRAIPIMLVSLLGIFAINLSRAFIFDKYYCYLPTICFLVTGFLLVSLLPTKTKKMPPSRVASSFIYVSKSGSGSSILP